MWSLLHGSGAGGDIRGAINAGCNAHDPVRQQAVPSCQSTLRLFTPKPDLMTVKPTHVAFGIGYLDKLGPYRDSEDGTEFFAQCQKLAQLGL